MSRPVLVTGASGFVGARVVRALRDAGRRVRAASRRRAPPAAEEQLVGDLRDEGHRARAVEGVGAVVHCAAALDPVPSAAEADEVNHRVTVALAEAASSAGADAYVFLSSQAALGWRPDAGLLDETATCAPTTDYGRSKRDAERGLADASLGGCRWLALRPPTVYGPEERRNFLALARVASLGVVPIPGSGANRMSFCHVENLVDAVLRGLAPDAPGGLLHVADARPVTLREVVSAIARAAGRPAMPVPVPLPLAHLTAEALELAYARRAADPPLGRARLVTLSSDCALDTARARAAGFPTPVGFEEGVGETVAAYRRAGLLPGAW